MRAFENKRPTRAVERTDTANSAVPPLTAITLGLTI